jgi:homoserine kinase
MSVVRLRVPATTANLGPGFDAFGIALRRYLELTATPREAGAARFTLEGEGSDELSTGDDNLVWRSVVAGCERVGADVPDVAVHVKNAIPLERGLGSSSAAIVAGLGLVRALTGAPLSDLDLVDLATELEGHPDNVAPAVIGGMVCAARTDDGDLVVRRTAPTRRLRPILLVPTARQETVEARAALPTTLDREAAADQAARAGHVLAALAGLWPVDARLAGDRLHEPARAAVMPPTAAVLDALRAAGVHAWISGAGPAVCAAIAVRDEAAHDLVADLAGGHGFAVVRAAWDLGGLLPA